MCNINMSKMSIQNVIKVINILLLIQKRIYGLCIFKTCSSIICIWHDTAFDKSKINDDVMRIFDFIIIPYITSDWCSDITIYI